MAKKQVGVSLRKPPPADVDAFVAGEEKPARASDVRALAPTKATANDITLTTENGKELREVTVYLPVELARKMSLRCAEKDRDASNLVADALAAHLATPAVAPEPAPVKQTRRTTTPAAAAFTSWTRSLTSLVRQRLFA
jgi:hypothetical protein